jgi:hypothetical protein
MVDVVVILVRFTAPIPKLSTLHWPHNFAHLVTCLLPNCTCQRYVEPKMNPTLVG